MGEPMQCWLRERGETWTSTASQYFIKCIVMHSQCRFRGGPQQIDLQESRSELHKKGR